MQFSVEQILFGLALLGNAWAFYRDYRRANSDDKRGAVGDLQAQYERVVKERDAAIRERDEACDDLMKTKSVWATWMRDEVADAIRDAVHAATEETKTLKR